MISISLVTLAIGVITIQQLAVRAQSSAGVDVDSPFEAEGGRIVAPMEIHHDPSASGHAYIVQAVEEGQGYAEYTVHVPSCGIYQLKGKVRTADSTSDSFYVSWNGDKPQPWHLGHPHRSWTWDFGPKVDLCRGQHELTISYREDGAQLDKIEIRTMKQLKSKPARTVAPTPTSAPSLTFTPTPTPTSAPSLTFTPAPAPTRAPAPTSTNTPIPTGILYVDPAGSDNNDGSATAPLRTLEKALELVQPGWAIRLRQEGHRDPA